MEQANAIRADAGDRNSPRRHGSEAVIEAFDHVLVALDEVRQLAESVVPLRSAERRH